MRLLDCFQRLEPLVSCDVDCIRIGILGSESYLGAIIFVYEAVDGGLQVDDGMKSASKSRRLVNLAKKPSTALSQELEIGIK